MARRNPSILDAIRSGMRVTIVDRFGKQHSGRAVMRGPGGWVLNMGGAHGTPGIADERNIVRVSGKPSGLGGFVFGGSRNPQQVHHSIGYPTKAGAQKAKLALVKRGGGPYKVHRAGGWWYVLGPKTSNPAIPSRWTPVSITRKGKQIQIRTRER